MSAFHLSRRQLFQTAVAIAAGTAGHRAVAEEGKRLRISLAEWSLHRAIGSHLLSNLDFPRVAREQFGIAGLEFVNWMWEAPTQHYIGELKRRIDDTGTQAVMIMCDLEGALGSSEQQERSNAVRNHYKWVDAAAELGCFAIRANMRPGGRKPEGPAGTAAFIGYCAESFHRLCEYAGKAGLDVLVENHGGLSSDPEVVVQVIKKVNLPNFGTLPDFGNFPNGADRYDAVRRMMPYAKDVSFKCHDFAPYPEVRETTMDMDRMMKIVLDSDYHGWIGIEYSGKRLTEFEGIQAAKRYLNHVLAV